MFAELHHLIRQRANSRSHDSRAETALIFIRLRALIRTVSVVETSGLTEDELHPPAREDHLPPLPHILLSAEGIPP